MTLPSDVKEIDDLKLQSNQQLSRIETNGKVTDRVDSFRAALNSPTTILPKSN